MKLVICGNGMDLHLGFSTNYQAYRKFLEEEKFIQGKNAISLIEKSKFFLRRDADCWSDLEKSLAFNVDKYIEEMIYVYDRKLVPYDENKSRSQIRDATEFERNNPEKIAFDFTNNWFFDWIGREFYSKVKQIKVSYDGILKSIFDDECIFVNFNYTPSLESIFGIEEGRILYIHNRFPEKPKLPFTYDDLINDILELGKKRFQFGSTENRIEEWVVKLQRMSIDSNGQQISKEFIESRLRSIYRSFAKNLMDNYEGLERFVSRYKIDEVIIYGHSFMGVDEPYYRDILLPILKDIKWTFFCYGSRESANIFIDKYSISKYKMIDC